MEFRREHSRYLCAELARVNWTVGNEAFETKDALLEDISTLGGCVQMEQPVPVGSAIVVTFNGERFSGKVRYCLSGEFGYYVGVKFADGNPWSKDLAMPAHLTNLERVSDPNLTSRVSVLREG